MVIRHISYKGMAKSAFGQRLKKAFGNATNGVIGNEIGVAENTVGFYVRGRIPDAEILIKISNVTGCNLHWLLTGEGGAFLNEAAFDLEYVIDEHEEWQDVLEEWYRWEGREMPADLDWFRTLSHEEYMEKVYGRDWGFPPFHTLCRCRLSGVIEGIDI